MRVTVSRSLCIGLLWGILACSPHRGASAFGPAPRCGLPLAPRINVRSTVTTSGLAALILDGSTNTPLIQAQLLVLKSAWTALTDSAGFARLPRLTGGSYTVRIRALGYTAVDDTIMIPPTGGRFVIVQLPRDVLCLPYPL